MGTPRKAKNVSEAITSHKVAYAIFHIQRIEHRGALISEIEGMMLEPSVRTTLTRRLILGIVEELVSNKYVAVDTETTWNEHRSTRLHFYRLSRTLYSQLAAEYQQEIEACTSPE